MKRFNRIRSKVSGAKRLRRVNDRRTAHSSGYPDDGTIDNPPRRDWKSLYRLRHKWSKGSCHYREISVPSQGPRHRAFIRIFNGVAITADEDCARAWAIKDTGQDLLATCNYSRDPPHPSSTPSALSINYQGSTATCIKLAVGFADGFIQTYTFDINACKFACLQEAFSAHDGQRIIALDFSSAHILSMSSSQVVALYKVSDSSPCFGWLHRPVLLQSLKSQTTGEPISLALRSQGGQAVISVAYVYPSYLEGWSVGIQELVLTSRGSLSQSRVATAQTRSVQSHTASSSKLIRASKGQMDGAMSDLARPLSVAYVHPYLLVNYGDNTLGVHLVRSNDIDIAIGPELRLWGHTSVVSANLGERGKAVTVAGGKDVRVWELEEAFKIRTSGIKGLGTISSVQVQPLPSQTEPAVLGNRLTASMGAKSVFQLPWASNFDYETDRSASGSIPREATVVFDEERLAVLHDCSLTSRLLSVYDFT